MKLPVYSEVSNIDTKKIYRKDFKLSVILVVRDLTLSLNTLNSIYNSLSQSKKPYELIIINTDKTTYQYDTIFNTFPFVRILFPAEKLNIKEIIFLGIQEAKSSNILFLNDEFVIKNLNIDILSIYLSESSFGILLPLIYDESENIIAGIVKSEFKKGFLCTFSLDIVGAIISSLYPKYFCFILNKNVFYGDFQLNDYKDENVILLELGYLVWKKGFIITQARNFKVKYSGKITRDFSIDNLKISEVDYVLFNIRNITSRKLVKGRFLKVISIIIKSIFSLNFEVAKTLIREILTKNKNIYPVEDFSIFTIINKDLP